MACKLENEYEAIRRCQQGELRAYELIYRHFEQPLLRIGLHMLGQQEDAEDAVQMTFLRLYRNINQFQFRSALGTYLSRIMMNVCFDILQKRNRDKAQELETAQPSYTPDDELRAKLQKAIISLPERMRACFVLFAIEEMKQNEIADILDLQIGTVKAQIFQAKQRLRTLLTDLNEGMPV